MDETTKDQEGKKEHRLRHEFRKQTFAYLVGALSLVAGLAWNDAVRALIDSVFPLQNNGLWAKFIYAGVLTVAIVLVTVYVSQLFNPDDRSKE